LWWWGTPSLTASTRSFSFEPSEEVALDENVNSLSPQLLLQQSEETVVMLLALNMACSRKDLLHPNTPSLPSSFTAFLQNLLLNSFLEKLLERTPVEAFFVLPFFWELDSDLMAVITTSEALWRAVTRRRGSVVLLLFLCWNPTVVQHCRRGNDLNPLDEHELRSSLR
jgi:hypothetical protein